MKTVRKVNIKKGKAVWVLFALFLSMNTLWAQDLLWKTNFTGSGVNYPNKSAIDSQNNIYAIGAFNDTCDKTNPILIKKGSNDVFIIKYDPNGKLIWGKQIGGALIDNPSSIVISPDDEYIYVSGVFQGTAFAENFSLTSSGSYDAFLAKYKKNGDIVWFKRIASASIPTLQRSNEIKIDKNNHLVIGGVFINEVKLGDDITNILLTSSQTIGMFISQFDTSGTVLNAKKFEASGNFSQLYTIDVDNTGYYLCGYFGGNFITDLGTKISNGSLLDGFVYKVDYDMNSQWIVKVSGIGDDLLTSCSVDGLGNIYVGGHFTSSLLTVDSTATGIPSSKTGHNKMTDGLTYDIFFAKYNSSGILQWYNTAGSTGNDYLYRALYKNGDFIAAGQCGGTFTFNNQTITSKGNGDAFAIVQDHNDNLKYLIPIGGSSGSEVGETAVVDNNGNFVVIGDYTSSEIFFGNNPGSLLNSHAGTKDMFIAKYDKASLTKVITPVLCHGSNTGTISITPMGAVVEPFTFAWTKREDAAFSATTEDIANLTAGTYRVTFTDALGYTKKDSVTLTDPPLFTVSLTSKSDVTCFNGTNGSITANVSGGTTPYSYVWTAPEGSGANVTSLNQVSLSVGTYSLSANDFNGCIATLNNIIITQPAKIVFHGTTVTNIISTGAVDLSVSGGAPSYTYSWQGPSGFTASTQDLINLSSVGTYSVHVSDLHSCTGDTSVQVNNGTLLAAFVQSSQHVKCYGGNDGNASVGVSNALGAISYSWDDPSASTTASVNNLSIGTYHVTVTDAGRIPGSNKAYTLITITQPAQLQIGAINKTNISCNNFNDGILDAVIIGGKMPYTYYWTKDLAYYATTEDLSGLAQGAYSLTVTDVNGCIDTKTDNLVNPAPIVISGTTTPVTCEGSKDDGAILLDTPSGGWPAYSYAWSNGLTSQSINLLRTGTYTLTVTDSRNCKATYTKSVGYEAPMVILVDVNPVSCKGTSTGRASVAATGHSPFSYHWNNDTTNSIITNVTAGSYTVTITDNKHCTKSQSVIINEPTAISLSAQGTPDKTDATCYGSANGAVSISAAGGTGSFNYTLKLNGTPTGNTSGANTGYFTALTPASGYSIEVTDANNCGPLESKITDIIEPSAIQFLKDSVLDATSTSPWNGLCLVIASGGTGPLTYSLNGMAQDTGLFFGLAPGNYTLTVTDQNNCGSLQSLALTISNTTAVPGLKQSDLKIYPNPVRDEVTLDFGTGLPENAFQIEVINGNGQTFYKKDVSSDSNNSKIKMNLGSLPRGMYLLKINNKVLKDKLILQ